MTNRKDDRARNLRSEFDAGRVLAGDAPLAILRVLDIEPRRPAIKSDAPPSYFAFNERKGAK